MFPSPLRGLIFHSNIFHFVKICTQFPSPLRGLIFHSLNLNAPPWGMRVSVPSSGTYLPFIIEMRYKILGIMFPSPLRGLIFHSKVQPQTKHTKKVSVPSSGTYLPFDMDTTFSISKLSFRPLFGDLSSIPLQLTLMK